MPKEKKPRKPDNSIEGYLCRTQGIGANLAKDIASKLKPEIRQKVESLIESGEPVNVVMAAFKPATEDEPPKKSKPSKTPTE
jgi:hypothetical protein